MQGNSIIGLDFSCCNVMDINKLISGKLEKACSDFELKLRKKEMKHEYVQ